MRVCSECGSPQLVRVYPGCWECAACGCEVELSVQARYEDAARAEADQAKAGFVERLKATGDEHARRLADSLDLPPGFRVVFDSEPLSEESA